MTRLAEWIIALLVLAAVVCVLSILPFGQPAPKSDPTVAALVEKATRLEAEVDMLRSQVEAVQARAEHRLTLMEARLALVDARVQALERVVPVQAIRDRARQR